MIEAMGWAIVAGCMMVNGPECTATLATGMVWGDRARCESELRLEVIPGAQCREVVGVEMSDSDYLAPGIENVIEQLNEGAQHGTP